MMPLSTLTLGSTLLELILKGPDLHAGALRQVGSSSTARLPQLCSNKQHKATVSMGRIDAAARAGSTSAAGYAVTS